MSTVMQVGDIAVHVTLKNVKNVHLGVYPPGGRVRIAAPVRMNLETIRALAVSKLPWIRRQRSAFLGQRRETPRDYVSGESHYVWGRRFLLSIEEKEAAPRIEKHHRRLSLQIRPGTALGRRAALLEGWYRQQIREALVGLLAQWAPIVGVTPGRIFIHRMRTKWGSCNPRSRNIRVNTELAKKPRECLEYILIHELIHLREPTHGLRFFELMDAILPGWETRRRELNRLPLRQEG